jgi:NAD(P)H-flavin reductase
VEIGNCPKYLNKKKIVPQVPRPKLEPAGFPLQQAAVDLVGKADLFFISSSDHKKDMDTNIRGGPPGFTRVLQNDENGLVLVYPEYSGNRLYQTLGNLVTTPKAGLVFPDFDTGDVLYVTGETEILAGQDAKDLIAHSNLAIKITVKKYKFVRDGLAFRAQRGESSPYNPPVRYLATEDKLKLGGEDTRLRAALLDRQKFSNTIARLRFRLNGQIKPWQPGQYVALDFSDELDMGYSHMREDDPKSLNDDWLRTFTISSHPDDTDGANEFEITVRKNGPVTGYLFSLNTRDPLEIGVQGFGGDFFFAQKETGSVSFIAAGVGITPLLAQVRNLELKRFRLYWTNRAEDMALVVDTFKRNPGLAEVTQLFVTGTIDEGAPSWKELEGFNTTIERRRITKADVENDQADSFYVCTAPPLRNTLIEWLPGKTVVYENFDY